MYYFCGKVNQGHVFCQFYRGSPYLRESVMGGSTVLLTVTRIKHNYVLMMCFLVLFFLFLQNIDLPGLSFGQQDYYPYVFFKLNLNLLEK